MNPMLCTLQGRAVPAGRARRKKRSSTTRGTELVIYVTSSFYQICEPLPMSGSVAGGERIASVSATVTVPPSMRCRSQCSHNTTAQAYFFVKGQRAAVCCGCVRRFRCCNEVIFSPSQHICSHVFRRILRRRFKSTVPVATTSARPLHR